MYFLCGDDTMPVGVRMPGGMRVDDIGGIPGVLPLRECMKGKAEACKQSNEGRSNVGPK